jgi:uncharacterized protein
MNNSQASVARQAYEAIDAGDHDTLRGLLADDVVWHVPGRSPLAGDHPGVEAVLGLFARIYNLTEGTYRVEIDDAIADEAHAVLLTRTSSRLAGAEFSDDGVQVVRVADGLLADVRTYSSQQERWDALIDEVLAARA